MRKPFSRTVVKKLFALSGNRCSFTDCEQLIVVGDTIVSDICHIEAIEPNGPRYRQSQMEEEKDSYDNLILLCPNHHRIVDNDPEEYTVTCLKKMKYVSENKNVSNPYIPSEEVVATATKLGDQTYSNFFCKKCKTAIGFLIGSNFCPTCNYPINN